MECFWNKTQGRDKLQQNEKKRGAILDDRRLLDNTDDLALVTGQYSLKNMLCNTVEFRHAPREVRLFVSRKEMWCILYPSAFAVFVLFYCIPIYDVSCTVSLIIGLLFKSCYDEVQRGVHWKRGTGRKICFVFAMLCGFLCASGLLVLSVIVENHSHENTAPVAASSSPAPRKDTNETPEHVDDTISNMLGTLLHGDDRNRIFRRDRRRNSTVATGPESAVNSESYRNMTAATSTLNMNISSGTPLNITSQEHGVSEEVRKALSTAYKSGLQNPNLLQMIFVWAACSYIPFFLGQTPDSIRLPVMMEMVQPSVSCLAAFVLFLICAPRNQQWDPGMWLQSPSFVSYVCLAPPAVWCAVYFITKASRSKTTMHVCCILTVAAYSKLLHVLGHYPDQSRVLSQVGVFVGCLCACYTGLSLVFIRMENKCIQMGWDGGQDDEDADDYGSDLELSSTSAGGAFYDRKPESESFSPRYTIEDVLERVSNDIKTTEYILSHPETKPAAVLLRAVPISTQEIPPSPMTQASVVQIQKAVATSTLLNAIEEDDDHSDDADLEKNTLLPQSMDSTKNVERMTEQ